MKINRNAEEKYDKEIDLIKKWVKEKENNE